MWYLVYFVVLKPVRALFGYLLPPILRYFWHNGGGHHLAQDDRPVYETIRCLSEGGGHREDPQDSRFPNMTRVVD